MRDRSFVTIPFFLAAVCLASAFIPVPARAAENIDRHLRDQYKGKVFVLRNFYTGSSLRFAPDGSPAKQTASGDWTVDGIVRIDDIKVKRDRLQILATRLRLGWVSGSGFSVLHESDSKGKPVKNEKHYVLEIEATVGERDAAPEVVDALLSKIFLTSHDSLVDAVPPYWKRCVYDGLAGNAKLSSACNFSREFLAVPGFGPPTELAADVPAEPPNMFAVKNGQKPPRAIFNPDPPFNDAARSMKYQGTVVLSLTVDDQGRTANVQITGPTGCGLDAQAVHAVEEWRFKPATKDGQPVGTEIGVEVSFHLY